MIETAAALATILVAFAVAPLILGSGVVFRHADRRFSLLWIWALTGLLAVAVISGLAALALLLF